MDSRIVPAWWALKIGLGVSMFAAGLDKFFNLLTNWSMYLSPLAERLLPFSADTFMHLAGVFEMLLGLAILTRWPRWGGYVLAAYLVAIAANLASGGNFYDLAVRDLDLAIAAFALASLTTLKENPRVAIPTASYADPGAARGPAAR